MFPPPRLATDALKILRVLVKEADARGRPADAEFDEN